MPHYRVYLLSADDRVAGASLVLECDDDKAALSTAARIVTDEHGAEVWLKDRLVGRLPACFKSGPDAMR